jgi:[glutamine synthetase] adenylyltransferase / [glutamine synthetase]-adenylyl-L-tyrosine phosphorylase
VAAALGDPAFLLGAPADSAVALRALEAAGFADPTGALANLHLLSPTPREAALLGPALPRLLRALQEAPDPDMALNNLERYAAACDRSVLYRTLAAHPGAALLLARVGGSSQFLADTLRRRPPTLAWLLEGRTMRQWLADDLGAALAADLVPFSSLDSRLNVIRRFRDRHLLRIGARDLLGDADLTITVEELSRLADVCLEAAWRLGQERLEALHGRPQTGFAVIGMGKLGGDELNYSSDVDILFVYGEEGQTTGGPAGALEHGEYAATLGRAIVAALETLTEEGRLYRVDLRLRPEGRVGSVALSLAGYRRYLAERAEPWERQALIKARPVAGDRAVGQAFLALVEPFVYRPGIEARLVDEIRAMKREIDRTLRAREDGARNVKLGPGGIREIEFLVQALQLLYGGDDPWLRERSTLKAIFRLIERGYLAPALGRALSDGYVHLRQVEHRLQILHELQTHSLPADGPALGRLARRLGITAPPGPAARLFRRRHAQVRRQVRRAFTQFFSARPRPVAARPRIPSAMALSATGFVDPDRARQNLRLLFEGRPLTPYPALTQAALVRLFPALMDALWQSPDPDQALNQFERFVAAAGPRTGYIELLTRQPAMLETLVRLCARGEFLAELLMGQPELLTALAGPGGRAPRKREAAFRTALARSLAPGLGPAEVGERLRQDKQAEELGIVWRHLSGLTTLEQYAGEMTALAEAALGVAWQAAQAAAADRRPVPAVPAVIVGLGKLGGRELTAGSDLDLFVVYGAEDDDRAHAFYGAAVERLSALLGDITAAGAVFPIDLRLRPGSTGSGLAASVAALERYHRDWGDLWERQALTRARLVGGQAGPAGRALARRVRAALTRIVYGAALGRAELKEILDVRQRIEVELGRESPGRLHVKYGRGGLVDVEFAVQALQLLHGAAHPAVRRPNTLAALRALGRAGLLGGADAGALAEHYRVLRRVSLALRLFGARPVDTLELAGAMPARLAKDLDYPDRAAFLLDYRRRTDAVRAIWERLVRG